MISQRSERAQLFIAIEVLFVLIVLMFAVLVDDWRFRIALAAVTLIPIYHLLQERRSPGTLDLRAEEQAGESVPGFLAGGLVFVVVGSSSYLLLDDSVAQGLPRLLLRLVTTGISWLIAMAVWKAVARRARA